MRPLDKSKLKKNAYYYKPYCTAKDDLVEAIGSYCSFCERHGHSAALDVEHIRHKSVNHSRTYLWSNFILACKNCNSIKGIKGISGIFFPTVHNTFCFFDYKSDGSVTYSSEVYSDAGKMIKAKGLSDLVGLDRKPGHPSYSKKDKRWSERRFTWALAERYLKKYQKNRVLFLDTIIDLAKCYGFWSIWMEVFKNEPFVIQALINDFEGTNLPSRRKIS